MGPLLCCAFAKQQEVYFDLSIPDIHGPNKYLRRSPFQFRRAFGYTYSAHVYVHNIITRNVGNRHHSVPRRQKLRSEIVQYEA